MTATLLLSLLLALGLLMYVRGLIYSMRPDGPMAKKRQKKNLKYGMSTDMLVFGKKVRRLGFMIALGGGIALAYLHAGDDGALTKGSKKETAVVEKTGDEVEKAGGEAKSESPAK